MEDSNIFVPSYWILDRAHIYEKTIHHASEGQQEHVVSVYQTLKQDIQQKGQM